MSASEHLAGARILVVEDEPDTRDLLSLVLGDQGAQVLALGDGLVALAAFDRFAPHVVVSDLSLPGIDGWALIRHLRERGASAPALALSANASLDDTARALDAGFNACLAKPIGTEDLIEAVQSVIDARGPHPIARANALPSRDAGQ